MSKFHHFNNRGSIVLMVLVFSGIFIILFSGTFGFIFTQHKFQAEKAEREKALEIAEAGANYYKWFLSHYPDDLTDGTGEPGPYEHEYYDPEGGAIGKFSLEISGVQSCGFYSAIDITSTGWTHKEPSLKRVVKVKYARPSVAEYAYILNDNVWAGADREIKGKYHSNGGIRMDGENDSLVTSAKTTWQCTSSFGCSSPYEVKPGVFGDGEGGERGLWEFPVQSIDFAGLSLDLVQMKNLAQAAGVYFAPQGKGYRVVFKNNGTFDAYAVNSVNAVYGYSLEEGYHWDYHVIQSETFLQNSVIPGSCSLIFVEDDLWLEGEVNGKVSIIAADLITPNVDPDIILDGNITYTSSDGSDGLLAVAERNVLIPLYSPDQMELKGIFIAQKGHFGRNHYSCSSYSPWCKRNKLEMVGSVVSNGRVGTKWTSGGTFVSGYENRENSYDRKLMTSPPPMTPFSDDEFRFVKWEEVN
ncbi:hypothetical protein KKB69_02005 [Patescibacteria group bacterium]|nr:hypothetical protein [Patescibacteria group bacterium]